MNTKKWTTRDGQKIRIKDMTDSHLLNTLNMLKRGCAVVQRKTIENIGSLACMVSGEMASYYADQDFDRALEAHWSDYAPDIFDDLLYEAVARKILDSVKFIE